MAPRHGTGMLRRFGWFYKALGLGRAFRAVEFEENSVERVREAASRGPVVYVLQHPSAVDHLALNAVLNRRRLPLSVWSNATSTFWWQPVREAWSDLWARVRGDHGDPVASGWLAGQVASGHVVTLFLQGGAAEHDPFEALLEAQASSERPIQLVPVVVQWSRAPELDNPVQNFLLGRHRAPGPLGQLRQAWFHNRGTVVQAGEPLDLAEFSRRARADEAVRALRTVLRRYLKRESTIIQGPRILSYNEMRRVVLDTPALKRLAEEEAASRGVAVADVRKQMEAEFKLIAARFRWWVVRVADVALRPIWTRIYSGVDVRPEDIEAIRSAMRDGSCVVIPCHKSHFDYLLLSWVFYRHNLIVPHVIAGANLDLPIVGHFFRSVGGFFIKRTFRGERIHPAVFARYLRELVFQGYPVEFYIEGGRTRSGKLLPAKTGVLAMLYEAAEVRPHDHEVTLLPMSLAYEEVAEQASYVREAGGEDKKPETVGQVLKARSVLSRRYGRVYLRVGEPIRCSEVVDDGGWTERPEAERQQILDRVGRQIMHRIGRVTVVLPTCLCAAALLAHHRRGIKQEVLLARVHRFRAILQRQDAMEAASLEHFDQAVVTALDRFTREGHVEPFELDGERVWGVVVDARIELEFYKNQLIHFLLPAGLAALIVRTLSDEVFQLADLLPTGERLVTLWDREFRFDPDHSAADVLQAGLDDLVAHGGLSVADEGYTVADPERMGEVHALFRNFVESYRVVLAGRAAAADHTVKTLPKHLADQGDRYLATGVATRPEALSTITMGNAVRALVDLGAFTRTDDALGAEEERCLAIDAWLAPMVE
jgi:glycerol-3-phosphate O-acyltransferase